MYQLYGMAVMPSPLIEDRPKFELSPAFRAMMRPEWVAEFDAWAAGFFGINYTIYVAQDPLRGKTVICSEAGLAHIRRACRQDLIGPVWP